MNEVDNYSTPVIFLEIYGNETGKLAGSATGFLLRAGARILLVTNWHVVAGRHSWNHEELVFNGATPDHFKAYFRVARRGEIVNEPVDVPIRLNDIPQWIEHKERKLPIVSHNSKFAIDVAIIDVTKLAPQGIVGELSWNGLSHFHLYPVEHISIIGYPFGLFGRDIYPIWISGTVANDQAGVKGQKYFLVDARSRPGNSGSLAIHRCSGASFRKPGGAGYPPGYTTHVIGVYSGRVFSKDSDIGIVWHWEVIDELIREIVPAQEQNWKTT
jgi:hypothetical protein